MALLHVVVGLQVHLRGKMAEYFVRPAGGILLPRLDPFGLANYAGLVAALILSVLLVTSNDVSLRRLGTAQWRRVHGSTYIALALTIAHGALYQVIERRAIVFVAVFALVSAAIVGVRWERSRHAGARDGPG